jgi:protein-tyrosine phosphatase
MTTVNADWENHHIEGYARAAMEAGEDGHFKAPLFSHIEDNLYVGGCIDGVRLPDDFQTVVSLYQWERYALGPNTERVEVEMYDAGEIPDESQLHELADTVNAALDRGGKVLVHCQAGLNRSNLVTALALIKRGRTPEQAIALLREKRSPVVLCNRAFSRWLVQQSAA